MTDLTINNSNFAVSLPLEKKLFSSPVVKELVQHNPDLAPMISTIQQNLPALQKQASIFGKHQSQIMNASMTMHRFTPLRTIRQALAEIEQIKNAMNEHTIKDAEKAADIDIKLAEYNKNIKKLNRIKSRFEEKSVEVLESMSDEEFDKYLDNESTIEQLEAQNRKLEVEIAKLEDERKSGHIYVSAAIRRMTDYTEQINSIKQTFGIDEFNEEAFEIEERRYHVITAFEQGTTAARARGGDVDEGNKIYFSNVGINGYLAQKEVSTYLQKEQIADAQFTLNKKFMENPLSLNQQELNYYNSIIQDKSKVVYDFKEPDYDMYIDWLFSMADKYSHCVDKKLTRLGLKPIVSVALLTQGDSRYDKKEE